MKIQKELFGRHPSGNEIFSFNIFNDNGISVRIINFGGIITHLFIPDKYGKTEDIVLGFDTLDGYLAKHPYFGAIVGRYANRIKNGRFKINEQEYILAINDGPNHLHGGISGFDKKIWAAEQFQNNIETGVNLRLESPDMEEGYPGNLQVTVQYSLNNNNELIIKYSARTDKPTHINITNHSYFNLSACKTEIYNHVLQINADTITENDNTNIPTGQLSDVSGTYFDFRKPKKIGQDIKHLPFGYDHNYVLNKHENELKLISILEDPFSGRMMETFTTQPGVQLYTSNFLDGSIKGKNNIKYIKHLALCLETQHFPDSPNQAGFPSTLLNPGDEFSQMTIYRFPKL